MFGKILHLRQMSSQYKHDLAGTKKLSSHIKSHQQGQVDDLVNRLINLAIKLYFIHAS